MSLAHHAEHGKGGAHVKVLSQKDIIEKLDGKKAKATMVEVTLAPGEVEAAHRHPGPGVRDHHLAGGRLQRALLDVLAGSKNRSFRNAWDYLDGTESNGNGTDVLPPGTNR